MSTKSAVTAPEPPGPDFGEIVTRKPVPELDIQFSWSDGVWRDLFDKNVTLIQQDIKRARAEDRHVIYLSCPISSRGGSFFGTNVDIALHIQNRLLREWGESFWILNPAQYQMQSKEGVGLLDRHARELAREKGIPPFDVKNLRQPEGGDYMRMWTRVLAEDEAGDNAFIQTDEKGKMSIARNEDLMNAGGRFDAFYFVGPSDVRDFFNQGGDANLTSSIEAYFTRKYAMDRQFFDFFNQPDPELWRKLRTDFFRYYGVRASTSFSSGSHDEWNIWRLQNERRLKVLGMGAQIPGFFDGRQIPIGPCETPASPGYAAPSAPPNRCVQEIAK